jgi:hypothetical protein
MINITKVFFLYLTINSIRAISLVSIEELSKNDIIINIKKGYALRHIGVYSPNVVEQIVHTFIPIKQFCMMSPETDVCMFSSLWKKTNVVELGTMMTSHHTVRTLSSYNSDSVLSLISKDLSQVLMQRHPDEIINYNKSIFHFLNNQFYYQKSDEKALSTLSTNKAINNYYDVTRLRQTSIEKILKQISNNIIGFEYLSDTDLKLFLTAILSSIDTSYTISNVQESLNTFAELIVGQSVFASRYCSLHEQISSPSQPCLIISTLFLRTPPDSTSLFSIYRLIALPIIFNDDKYVYSNLPRVVGINSIDQTLLIWNDEFDMNECTFSYVVQCKKMPVLSSLSKLSCLSQLFDQNQLVTSMCEVRRSQNIDQDVIDISNGIWLFNNIQQTQYCQISSSSNELVETITINEPSIVRIPCNNTLTCIDYQLPALSCTQHRLIVTPNFPSNIRQLSHFILPIKNMTKTLVSTYEVQLEKTIKDMKSKLLIPQLTFKQLMHDFGLCILAFICFIIFTLIIVGVKWIKNKDERQLKFVYDFVDFVYGTITG